MLSFLDVVSCSPSRLPLFSLERLSNSFSAFPSTIQGAVRSVRCSKVVSMPTSSSAFLIFPPPLPITTLLNGALVTSTCSSYL